MAGDFNGDGKTDIGVLYDYGSSDSGILVFLSNGPGFNAPTPLWRSGAGNWTAALSKPTVGDFDGDGDADVAILYDYGHKDTGLHILMSTGTGLSLLAPALQWRSGVGNWSWSDTKITSGDFNGDGRTDVAFLYDYGNRDTGLLVSSASGGSLPYPASAWRSGAGAWGATRSRLLAGKFAGTARADLAVAYDYFNSDTALLVFKSGASGFSAPVSWWRSTGFDWWRFQFTVGDFDGDGRTDIAGLYEYDNLNAGMWRFKSNASSFAPALDWTTGVGNWNVVSTKTF